MIVICSLVDATFSFYHLFIFYSFNKYKQILLLLFPSETFWLTVTKILKAHMSKSDADPFFLNHNVGIH